MTTQEAAQRDALLNIICLLIREQDQGSRRFELKEINKVDREFNVRATFSPSGVEIDTFPKRTIIEPNAVEVLEATKGKLGQ